jgi:hypothetical protein
VLSLVYSYRPGLKRIFSGNKIKNWQHLGMSLVHCFDTVLCLSSMVEATF